MKKGLMVALAAIAVTVSVAGCGGDGKLSNDYVTVNQYKGLEIAKVEKKEVSDDDVEQTIEPSSFFRKNGWSDKGRCGRGRRLGKY